MLNLPPWWIIFEMIQNGGHIYLLRLTITLVHFSYWEVPWPGLVVVLVVLVVILNYYAPSNLVWDPRLLPTVGCPPIKPNPELVLSDDAFLTTFSGGGGGGMRYVMIVTSTYVFWQMHHPKTPVTNRDESNCLMSTQLCRMDSRNSVTLESCIITIST